MGKHLLSAEVAPSTTRDAGDQNFVTLTENRNRGTHLFNDSDAFMAENSAFANGWDIAFQDVKVRSADCDGRDSDDSIVDTLEYWSPVRFP